MHKLRALSVALLFALMVIFAQVVTADTVLLRDGRQVSGEILSALGSDVVIVDEYGIEYRIAKTDIEGILFGDTPGPDRPSQGSDQTVAAQSAESPTQPQTARDNEPNNDFATATRISPNTAVTGSMKPKDDRDFFKLTLDKAGVLKVAIVTNNTEARPGLRFLSADNNSLTSMNYADAGSTSLEIPIDISAADLPQTVYIELSSYSSNVEFDYQLNVGLAEITDPYEVNSSFGQAAAIEMGKEISAYFFPKGDRDWYRLVVAEPGQVRVSLTNSDPAVRPGLRLVDANNSSLTSTVYADDLGKNVSIQTDVATPTVLYIEAIQYDSNRRSLTPYLLKTALTPIADEYEPNNDFNSRTEIPLGETISAWFFPAQDHDFHMVEVDKPGFLTVSLLAQDPVIVPGLRILSSDNSSITNITYASEPLEVFAVTIQAAPGQYTIQVVDYNNRRSLLPYQLKTVLDVVADDFEPNNRFSEAVAIVPGKTVQATIFPAGDSDWYTFNLPAKSEVVIEAKGDSPLRLGCRLVDANNGTVMSITYASEAGEKVTLKREVAAGNYFIEVLDYSSSVARKQPYSLTVSVKQLESPATNSSITNVEFSGGLADFLGGIFGF